MWKHDERERFFLPKKHPNFDLVRFNSDLNRGNSRNNNNQQKGSNRPASRTNRPTDTKNPPKKDSPNDFDNDIEFVFTKKNKDNPMDESEITDDDFDFEMD